MRRRSSLAFAVTVALIAAVPAAASGPAIEFRVQRLTDRVTVFTEISPWESNHVVILGAEGAVLVDPGHTPLMGRLIREAVARELGRERFDYVIDTHAHWGHSWGNAAFPEALVVGHSNAVAAINADAANLAQREQVISAQALQAAAAFAELDPDSEGATAARLRKDHLERIASGLAEDGLVVQPPRLTFSDRLTLDLGDVTLQLFYLGAGHSTSDVVILIPEEKILLMGCFFLEQGPLPMFGGQPELEPDRWLAVLDAVLDPSIGVERVVLGQHTVWSRGKLVAMRDYIRWLWLQVQELDEEEVDVAAAMANLPLPAELQVLRAPGVSDADLAGYHRAETTVLWRQLQQSAAAMLAEAIDEGGAAAGVARYRELADRSDRDVYFDEAELNQLGYRLLGEQRYSEAIAVLELNVEAHPDSWNAYDSLGEACMGAGDRERAIELYRRSLELNPDNSNGEAMLERLGASL